MQMPSLDSINYTIAILTLAGFAFAIWRSPGRKRGAAVADAILGKAEVKDNSGNVLEASQPGLVHRVATVEEAVVEFRHSIALYTELAKRLDIAENEIRLLRDSTVERVAIRLENAQAMRWAADEQGKPPAEPIEGFDPEGEPS